MREPSNAGVLARLAEILAHLSIQSERYHEDEEFRIAVDNVLSDTRRESPPSTEIDERLQLPWILYRGGNFMQIGAANGYEEYVGRTNYLAGPLCIGSIETNSTEDHRLKLELSELRGKFILEACNTYHARKQTLQDLGDALSDILHAPRDAGPCHHGFKENYEWAGRSPKVWKNALAALEAAQNAGLYERKLNIYA